MGFWREGRCDEGNDDLVVERGREARRIRHGSGPIGRAELCMGGRRHVVGRDRNSGG
jgi:hypothetical protein